MAPGDGMTEVPSNLAKESELECRLALRRNNKFTKS